ncbi:unnamed protein product [Didymodactylos carnosus]|uniref:NAD(P)(+)--arginine ADP-ribosyltransferase n=1 Tax=Didymodactylos carnosus TaxID=1234261 RepID=A0A815QHT0_9BILA|nr:unnamed protein product [Didymodactylos carnosus]CAF1463416.1 unnamed protein product [Didymodactylos carnosus]CAF4096092.1 unnamed protein product [Didymodactylos carnosus]CAF4333115.1 unnamed protein product [Didymodactylos carnosus]
MSSSQSDHVFLVLSHPINQQNASNIDNLQQIKSIYIFSNKINDEGRWTRNIPNYINDQNKLALKLHKDISPYRQEPFPMSILNVTNDEKSLQDLDEDSQKYIWYYLLFDVLKHMPGSDSSDAKKDMIEMCKNEFKLSDNGITALEDYERSTSETQSTHPSHILWYTKESFLHRTLDKAIRSQNISHIFNFRFFINGIQTQLLELYSQSTAFNNNEHFELITYRGQVILSNELHSMRKNVGKLMCVNSFFSTTLEKEVALGFMRVPTSDVKRVLFIITANTEKAVSQPFAQISSASFFPDEEEVLYMAGTVFRIDSVQMTNSGEYYEIRLILNDKNDEKVKELLGSIKHQLAEENSFITFGDFLIDLGRTDDAQKYCEMMLKKIDQKHYGKAIHPIYVYMYNTLGQSFFVKGDYHKARERYQFASKLSFQNQGSRQYTAEDSQALALTCTNLGLVYFQLQDYGTALRYFRQARDIRKDPRYPIDEVRLAKTYSYIALSQKGMGNKEMGLKTAEKALKYAKRLPERQAVLGWALLSQAACSRSEEAEKIYLEALNVFESGALPKNHPDLVYFHLQISKLYRNLKEFKKAEEHDQKALFICKTRNENPTAIKLCEEYITLDKNPPARKYSI